VTLSPGHAVASISRWSARDPMGGRIKAIENELTAIDDRTFRWSVKKPFPKMLLALAAAAVRSRPRIAQAMARTLRARGRAAGQHHGEGVNVPWVLPGTRIAMRNR
jgi:hypothetical protein